MGIFNSYVKLPEGNQWNDHMRIIHKNVALTTQVYQSQQPSFPHLFPMKIMTFPMKIIMFPVNIIIIPVKIIIFPVKNFKKKHVLCENHDFPCKKSHVPCEHHHNPCENHHVLSKMATQSTARSARSAAAVRMTPAGSTLQSAQEALLEDLVFFGRGFWWIPFWLDQCQPRINNPWLMKIVVFPQIKK